MAVEEIHTMYLPAHFDAKDAALATTLIVLGIVSRGHPNSVGFWAFAILFVVRVVWVLLDGHKHVGHH